MILLAKLRAHFYTGDGICLYRATSGAVYGFEKFWWVEINVDKYQGDNDKKYNKTAD